MHRGSCLCGRVTFEVTVPLPPPDGCHCVQCRKHSGHFFVSTDVPRAAFTLHGAENVTWFQSSEMVRRGFCAICSASLFFDPLERDWIGIAMGAFDHPTNTAMAITSSWPRRATTTRSPTVSPRTRADDFGRDGAREAER